MRAGLGRTRTLFWLLGSSALIAPGFPAFAQAVWDGSNGYWFDTAPWSTGVVPDASTPVTINSGRVEVDFPGAEAAGITLSGTGLMRFTFDATADNLAIDMLNRDDSSRTGEEKAGLIFFGVTSAGNATLNLSGVGNNLYRDAAVNFVESSSAGTATITVGNYVQVAFFNDSTAGAARFVSNGGLIGFQNNASAGSARITNNAGGVVVMAGNSTAAGATIVNNAGGAVDVSARSTQFTGNGTRATIGSLSGAGDVYLGSAGVTLGALNQNDTISGAIHDGYSPQFRAYLLAGNPGAVLPEVTGGSLEKVGTGTLTLTGTNTYAGGTIITAGTLQLGNGGTSGSIVGNVANNATLAFNRSNTVSFTGAISGTGTVRQDGAGTTILTADNSYTGDTTVNAGTLQLGNGGTSGSIVGNVANNGVLAFNRSDALTLDGVISGSGTLRQIGTGTTNLTGDSSAFTGATSVEAGTLVVNGLLAGSAVTVQSGARLGGSGTVGATTLASGSRITPGNSIGTLTVNGAYVQNAGAVYEVEIDPRTVTSDRIQVNGTATLASGATISVLNYGGAAYVAGQRYTILTSTGLTGSYGNTDLALTPFLNLRNSTDATNAYLTVIQTRTVASIGITPNQVAVGTSVDSLPAGNAVQVGVINTPTVDAARGALGHLAGEIHASARTVLVDESWLLRAAVNDRLRSAFGTVGASPMATLNYGFTADLAPRIQGAMPKLPSAERFAVWGQGYGSWGRTGSDGNAASLTRSTGGLIVGADVAAFDTLRFGVVAGYSRSTFSVNGRLSSGESDNYHLGLYGGGQWGALGLRTGVSYTWHDVSTRRGIIAAGLGDLLRADYDAGTAQVFGELGYRIELGQTALGQVALEPFAGLAYVVLRSDGFAERGGAAALSGTSDDTSLGYATLGLRAATTTRLQGMDLTLRGGLGWRHAFGDVDPKMTLAFSGSTPFSISGLPIARNAALVEAGLDIVLGTNTTLGASYTAQLAKDAQDHAFKANLAVRF